MDTCNPIQFSPYWALVAPRTSTAPKPLKMTSKCCKTYANGFRRLKNAQNKKKIRPKHNLLSVSHMCDQGIEVIFRSNGCSVHDLDTGKIVIKGIRTPNNLYIFKEGQQQCYLSKNDGHWLLSFSQIRKACKYQSVCGLPDIRIPDNTI